MKKRNWIIILVVIIVLIGLRIALPHIVLRVVNNKLSNLEGYKGHVKDIDMQLYRGAYLLDSIDFVKTSDSLPVPFVSIKSMDISVQWEALFDGRIVTEIILNKPELNFAVQESGTEKVQQSGENVDWVTTLKELTPFSINRLKINNGTIAFKDYSSEPEVDIRISRLELLAENLTNINAGNEKLPSNIKASGTTMGAGKFNLSADMNVLKEVPDLDLNFELEDVQMVELNNFLRAYTNTDAEQGVFNLYTEIAVNNNELTGYVKPIMENLKILKWKQEDEPFINKVWQGIVGTVTELFENQPKDRFATQVPLEGSLKDLDTGLITTLWNIFRNAFIEAFNKSLENTVELENEQE